MDVALITVTYNGGDTSLAWADAVQRAWANRPSERVGSLRAIAVDNASPDGTAQRLAAHAPHVEVLPQPVNAGFAAGCNVGLRAAAGSDVFVLVNPDVVVSDDFFRELYWLPIGPEIGAVGPYVVGADGEVEQSARRFPGVSTGLWGRTTLLTKLFPRAASSGQLLADPAGGRREVDWVSGACTVIPAAALAEVGLLDEGYFMYWEDADWCRRAHDRGLKVVYDPALAVSHQQGSSSATRRTATTLAFHRSAYRYYRLHVARNPVSRAAGAAVLAARCAVKLVLLTRRS